MDYEKKYKEALETARKINSGEGVAAPPDWTAYEVIFPELKESEDERIKNRLIQLIEMSSEVGGFALHKWEADEMLAWLEKQGEQKPADNVKPKFKVGDWVVTDKNNVVCIKSIDNVNYVLNNTMRFTIDYVDKCWHLWAIQDAKPGDVIYLPNGNNEYYFFIFKGIENETVMSFAHFYQYNDGTFKVEGTTDNLSSVNDVFQPATKEQRELLFQKIREAGYEWDAENKDLKKIEYDTQLTEFEDAIQDMMNAYRDAIGDNDATIEEVKNHAAYMLSLIHQKSAWTEEDEKIMKGAVSFLIEFRNKGYENAVACIDWLNSLKQRMEE